MFEFKRAFNDYTENEFLEFLHEFRRTTRKDKSLYQLPIAEKVRKSRPILLINSGIGNTKTSDSLGKIYGWKLVKTPNFLNNLVKVT